MTSRDSIAGAILLAMLVAGPTIAVAPASEPAVLRDWTFDGCHATGWTAPVGSLLGRPAPGMAFRLEDVDDDCHWVARYCEPTGGCLGVLPPGSRVELVSPGGAGCLTVERGAVLTLAVDGGLPQADLAVSARACDGAPLRTIATFPATNGTHEVDLSILAGGPAFQIGIVYEQELGRLPHGWIMIDDVRVLQASARAPSDPIAWAFDACSTNPWTAATGTLAGEPVPGLGWDHWSCSFWVTALCEPAGACTATLPPGARMELASPAGRDCIEVVDAATLELEIMQVVGAGGAMTVGARPCGGDGFQPVAALRPIGGTHEVDLGDLAGEGPMQIVLVYESGEIGEDMHGGLVYLERASFEPR